MCGLTGAFHVDGRPVSVSMLRRMTDALAHRGPDGEGFWTSSFVGFGHRRLAIIDLSPAGHQPMQSPDGQVVLVYNGEIYDFQNLRLDLESKGHLFRSRSDTEVLLHAYLEWGVAAVERLNGMFAFAIWDGRNHELVLARDRYGVKPLYYRYHDGLLLFGSEIKAILAHPDVSVRVDAATLTEYFAFQNVLSDRTLFDGIRLLPAGETLRVRLGDRGSLVRERYWDYDFRDAIAGDDSELVEELVRLIEGAVGRQLVSDVEIGSYLSGGMDSGSVTALAALQSKSLKTFTCGFDLSSASGLELGFDERAKAEYLSNLFKTEQYEVVLKAGDMERVMPELIRSLEDLRLGQSYPNYYVARLASKFVKVVLSGAGGDELFAGYPWRYRFGRVPGTWSEFTNARYKFWQRLVPDAVARGFFQPSVVAEAGEHDPRRVFEDVIPESLRHGTSPADYVNRSLYFEAKTFLHGLFVVEDKLSMAHGLETRVPFLDNDLVDFAMRVPVAMKLQQLVSASAPDENEITRYAQTNDGKVILRRAFARLMPNADVKAVKQGFSAPDASWFKGESLDYIRRLLFDRRARIYDFVEPATAQALMEEHFAGKTNRRLLIWSLLCFEWWNRVFVP